jgi:hypothetical protein
MSDSELVNLENRPRTMKPKQFQKDSGDIRWSQGSFGDDAKRSFKVPQHSFW